MLEEEHRFVTIYCSHCGHPIRVQLNCGDRTCPICRKKWYGHHYFSLLECVKNWKECFFLTLTAKNIPDQEFTKEYLKGMRREFAALRRRYESRISGGFYVVQATNRGNGWHVHLHVLFDGAFISVRALSRAWAEISGNRIVDIRKVNNPKQAVRYMLSDFLQQPRIREEDHWLYNEVFAGSRLVQPFGKYRKTKFRAQYTCPDCGATEWVVSIDRYLLSCVPDDGYNYEGRGSP